MVYHLAAGEYIINDSSAIVVSHHAIGVHKLLSQ